MLSVILQPVCSLRAFALEYWPMECYVASEGACLMDADSHTVLFTKDANTAYYPASITKVLTALVTLENCDNLSEQVTFSYDAVHIEEENSTIIGASEGDRLSVLDCLYSLLFQSANEVANALAEHVGAKHPELKEQGETDRDVFVKMMNRKAVELGCTGSHFNNPSGLTDADHYTTAYDMCLIMADAIRNETFLDIEKHTYWTHGPIRRYPDADDPWNTVYPKHLMLKRNSSQYYQGTIAGKTGYTMNAGNTLVTACTRNGTTLVTCVLNAHANHYNDTRRLMDFGFDNFMTVNVSDYDNTANVIEKDFSIGSTALINSYTLGIAPDTKITLPKNANVLDVAREMVADSIDDTSASAEVRYTYGTRVVGTAKLKLTAIGSDEALLREAENDPLLAGILEVAPKEELRAAAEEAEDPEAHAEGEDAAAAEDTAEFRAVAEAENAAEAENEEAAENAAEAGRKVTKTSKGIGSRLAKFVKPVLAGAGLLGLLGALIVFIQFRRENREAQERARRRAKRLQRTKDMSGSQSIEMDLQVQRRLRKPKRKRNRRF